MKHVEVCSSCSNVLNTLNSNPRVANRVQELTARPFQSSKVDSNPTSNIVDLYRPSPLFSPSGSFISENLRKFFSPRILSWNPSLVPVVTPYNHAPSQKCVTGSCWRSTSSPSVSILKQSPGRYIYFDRVGHSSPRAEGEGF